MPSKASSLWSSRQPTTVKKDETALLEVCDPARSTEISALRRLHSDSWCWEILGITFSLACSVALIILLKHYDSGPVPHWHHGITVSLPSIKLCTKGALLI